MGFDPALGRAQNREGAGSVAAADRTQIERGMLRLAQRVAQPLARITYGDRSPVAAQRGFRRAASLADSEVGGNCP